MIQHIARKRFGQNFLQDMQVIHHILNAINPVATDNLLEIGPGLGALTKPLLKGLNKLHAIEIDRDLQAYLLTLPYAKEKLLLTKADALTVDYSQLGSELRIIGNLPYNISTPLLIHLISYLPNIKDMHFMLQKEVVQRIAANPGSKNYGRLSILLQYFCEVEHLFDVPATAFDPQPKVESAIIRLIPYTKSPYEPVDIKILQSLLVKAFAMRRKTLNNNLKEIISAEKISSLDIDPRKRPEDLSIEDYIKIAKFISK